MFWDRVRVGTFRVSLPLFRRIRFRLLFRYHPCHKPRRSFVPCIFFRVVGSLDTTFFFPSLLFFCSGWYATPSTSDPSLPSFRRIDPRTTRSVSSNPTLLPVSCAMSRGDPRSCNPVGGGPSSSSSRPSPGSKPDPSNIRERRNSLGGGRRRTGGQGCR